MAKDRFLVIRGTLHWAKVLGTARPHTGLKKYDKGPSWSVDVTPSPASLKAMEEAGILDKLKDPTKSTYEKEDRTEKFLSLSVYENKADGTKNSPPKVIDAANQPWGDALIGNGTVADVKVKVKEYEGAPTGVYLQAIRVLLLVEYESDGFEPLSSDDEFFGGTVARLPEGMEPVGDEDLDDDVPF
jgi:hypothetical protein